MERRKFIVICEWDYACSPAYEKCSIRPATEDDEYYDGYNFVSGPGRSGLDINIYNSLEESILKASFNPFCIDYNGLNLEESIFKDNFLKQIEWDPQIGIKFIKGE